MDIYREEILEHWRSPQNFGKMAGADVVIDQINPLCGDQVRFYFKLGKPRSHLRGVRRFHLGGGASGKDDVRVIDVSFTGNGCAISIASASILSDFIKGKSVQTLSKITGEDVLDLIGGAVAPARLKCVFLALEAVRKLKTVDN